jgi:uncharacterized BrkB/YihY/UPF0761 family membrane protein
VNVAKYKPVIVEQLVPTINETLPVEGFNVAEPFIENIEDDNDTVTGVWGNLSLVETFLIVKKHELALPGLK